MQQQHKSTDMQTDLGQNANPVGHVCFAYYFLRPKKKNISKIWYYNVHTTPYFTRRGKISAHSPRAAAICVLFPHHHHRWGIYIWACNTQLLSKVVCIARISLVL